MKNRIIKSDGQNIKSKKLWVLDQTIRSIFIIIITISQQQHEQEADYGPPKMALLLNLLRCNLLVANLKHRSAGADLPRSPDASKQISAWSWQSFLHNKSFQFTYGKTLIQKCRNSQENIWVNYIIWSSS